MGGEIAEILVWNKLITILKIPKMDIAIKQSQKVP